ncbi:phospholipase-like protein [Tanacetum coccineum]
MDLWFPVGQRCDAPPTFLRPIYVSDSPTAVFRHCLSPGKCFWWWCSCCGGVVVGLWWCCGGGVVLLLWLLFGSGVVLLNMENYEDDPVSLTCRSKLTLIKEIRKKFRNTFREELFRKTCFGWLLDLDDSQENCVLIHFMSCRQVERSPEDTVVVPLTYHVNGHYIEFGREEFCLITGLRFGPEFSDRYEVGPIPFRRLVFDSDKDGGHVNGQMLLDIINGEEFDNLHDEVAVAVCQLAVLHFVLLVWAQLYGQFENTNVVRAKKLYAAQNRPIPRAAKYTLSGFTWAFKGARPNRRLRPDAFEARAEWWVRSREFFDGRIHEAPSIPTPVKLPSRFDVPKNVDPRYDELINSIKELKKKNEAHEKMLKKVYKFYQGQSQPKPMEVPEHYGLSDFDFSVLQNTEARPSVIPATPHIVTPLSQQGFAPWSSTNQAGPSQNHDVGVVNRDEMPRGKRETFPSKYQLSPFTCMPTTTVAPKKRANNTRNKTRSDKVSAFNIEKAGIDLNSPVEDLVYMGSHDTDVYISLHNVDPNKVVRNQYVDCMTFLGSPKLVFLDCGIKGFVVEEQFWRDLVPYVCKGGNNTKNNYQRFAWLSEDHINFWMELMIRDRPPGARYTVAKTRTSAMIEKSNKFVIETDFHLMGMLDGSSRPYPSWDDVDIVYMPINSGGDHWVTGVLNLRWSTIHVIDSLNNPHRKKQLMDHISKWTNVLNVLLEKAGHFERTGRQPYNFELVYNDGLEFASPQQGNSSDCGVVTCWVIESLFMGRAPVLYNVDPNFFFSDLSFWLRFSSFS